MARYFDPLGIDYTTQVASFSTCGGCQNRMELKSKGEDFALRCLACNVTLSLPKSLEVTPYNHTCPLCQFQVRGLHLNCAPIIQHLFRFFK
jgi:hypothetical protein